MLQSMDQQGQVEETTVKRDVDRGRLVLVATLSGGTDARPLQALAPTSTRALSVPVGVGM